ncbi:MAG: DUF3179 domain-containing protein [SAR202 cluster bacterium]|nr:DUF3179 domain-containing protein [SAR202 cluster bacterium]
MSLTEIIGGGPGKDGIPAIDQPDFVPVPEADQWLDNREPVLVVDIGGDARAYPLQILIWHEIVNDQVGGQPITVTYCPLCNTGLVFDARISDGQVLEFGVSGNLRHSDLVMYDRTTESWWQQATGTAIVGELAGYKLEPVPATLVSWKEFKTARPGGKVLSKDTGYLRPYGSNPYQGYDTGKPFLFQGPADNRLPAAERVVTVTLGKQDVAFPFSLLKAKGAVSYTLDAGPVVVFHKPGTASALDDSSIAQGRDVGAAAVFVPQVEGRQLTFSRQDEVFQDQETGSYWNLLGEAVAGPLAGKRLEPVVHGNHFWFAWAVFKPGTVVVKE